MLDLARHPEGTVTLRWQPPPEGLAVRTAGALATCVGFVLLLLPVAGRGLLELALLFPVEVGLLLAGLRLLASVVRRGRFESTLHVGSGELSVRAGHGPLAARQAFGAVDADHLLLSKETAGEAPRFRLAVVTRSGPPVPITGEETDEETLARAGLMFAEGMGVPFVDRRYPDAAGRGAPGRVGRLGGDRLAVYVWTYRDRFRPRTTLLALGLLAAASRGLPLLVPALGAGLLLPAVVVLVVGLGAAAHLSVTVTTRRVIFRSDAVRLERSLAGVRLAARIVPFERLAAVLLTARGPHVTVRLRRDDRRTAATLPFEDPEVAAWLKLEIERAVHAAARAGAFIPAGGPPR
jgi:hypothetical protein